MKLLLIVAFLLVLPVRADEDFDARRVTFCRLAYDYSPRDGALTCAGGHYRTYYPSIYARRARRLPAGVRLTIEYLPGRECGSGCWTRVLRIE